MLRARPAARRLGTLVGMAWLRVGDNRIPLEVADDLRSRARGLLGRDGIDHALLLDPAASVHTIGMRFAIDVAFLDAHDTVVATRTMPPHRLGRPFLSARRVIEAEAGRFARWGLRAGTVVAIDVPRRNVA